MNGWRRTGSLSLAVAAIALLAASLGAHVTAPSASAQDTSGVAISVTLPAEGHATPRDWYFEVYQGDELVDAVTIGTAWESPTGSATLSLAPGEYLVRLPLNAHIGLACDDVLFFRIVTPESGGALVTVDDGTAEVAFELETCPNAPTNLQYERNPAAQSAPLPPNTGSGLAASGGANGSWALPAIAGVALISLGAGIAVAARRRATPRA